MLDRKIFFDRARRGLLGPTLDQGEVDGCTVILDAFAAQPLSFVAYALATAYHETNQTMQPVREAYWLSDAAANRYFFRMYDIQGQRPKVARALGNIAAGDGARFPGMGYPQTTGRANYQRAKDKLGVDFIKDPKFMMVPRHAAAVMLRGMLEGWFTGKKLADYLPLSRNASLAEFKQARRIINGTDKAADIAAEAVAFQAYLTDAGYSR